MREAHRSGSPPSRDSLPAKDGPEMREAHRSGSPPSRDSLPAKDGPRTADRAFRWLLKLLPWDFRADYGRDMQLTFREQHREATERGTVAALWRQVVADVVRTAPREHAAQLRQDTSFAWRSLLRQPAFVVAAVLTLALGIGANTAVFSLVWTVLLKPLPYGGSERLVAVWNRWDKRPQAALSEPEYLDYAENTSSVAMAAEARTAVNIVAGGEPERVSASYVTASMLDVLQVAPAVGRGFRPEEEREPVAVAILSDALWRRRFGADPGVVGRAIQVDGASATVVGVLGPDTLLPSDFRGAERAELVMPLPLDRAARRDRRGGHYLLAVGRLQPGVELRAAQAQVDALVARLMREYPDEHDQGNFGVSLLPLRDNLLGPARPVLAVLSGAVALVLLLTCANVASLLLARSEGRRRELAVRSALGADRPRLVRQLLTEAGMIGVAGAAAGLFVAWSILRAVVQVAQDDLPRVAGARLDVPVLLFAIGVALAAAFLFGALPAVQVSQVSVSDVLGEGGRGFSSGRTRARRLLVATQVAMAMVLLAGAGLLLKSFVRLQSVASGIDPQNVLSLRLTVPDTRYPGRPEVAAWFARLTAEVRALPGVEAAGAANGLPLAVSTGDWSFDVEGRPREGEKHHGAADWFAVTPGYFEALRVRQVSGRLPVETDTWDAPKVIFLNETAAKTFFPGQDPLGQRLQLTSVNGGSQPWRTVAGVVGDVRHRGLERPPRPEMYLPHQQFLHFSATAQARAMSLVVRTAGEPQALARPVRDVVRRLDPEVAVAQVKTMDEVMAMSLAERRRNLGLIGAFAALALLLAAVGLYGLLATTVAQRTREIGVRMAVGARAGQVVGMVVGQALRLVAAGIAAGLVVALAVAGVLADMLFSVVPRDVGVFAAVAGLLALVAALASTVPALRAARIQPVLALRHD
jgi:putative ABC transport system permease protein